MTGCAPDNAGNSAPAPATRPTPTGTGARVLLAYFSRAGENYPEPYSDDYDDTVARNVREQDTDARPAIANPLQAIASYDVVLLGSGIWNVRPPMIMRTFAESLDFTGKTVLPVTTYAMSGLGRASEDYADACPVPPSATASPYAAKKSTRHVTPSRRGCGAPVCTDRFQA